MVVNGKARWAVRGCVVAAASCVMLAAAPANAQGARCGNDGHGFNAWLQDFRGRARAAGISEATLDRALANVNYDRNVVRLDRSQRSFKLSFEEFYKRRVGTYLINSARTQMKRHAGLLDRVEKRYGVPREILVSIWGLETNFGRDGAGKHSIIQAIATLSYDCRRSAFFTEHLMAAMRIVQKRDMSPEEMRGGWAGEIGQVQFLPGSYDKYAVDFDGDGRRDLVKSVPDMLASTAHYLQAHGWKRGAAWGPGTANYDAIKAWNKAEVYARTISVMAERLSD